MLTALVALGYLFIVVSSWQMFNIQSSTVTAHFLNNLGSRSEFPDSFSPLVFPYIMNFKSGTKPTNYDMNDDYEIFDSLQKHIWTMEEEVKV